MSANGYQTNKQKQETIIRSFVLTKDHYRKLLEMNRVMNYLNQLNPYASQLKKVSLSDTIRLIIDVSYPHMIQQAQAIIDKLKK